MVEAAVEGVEEEAEVEEVEEEEAPQQEEQPQEEEETRNSSEQNHQRSAEIDKMSTDSSRTYRDICP